MKLILSNSFITRLSVAQYPLVGMWYSTCSLSVPKFQNYCISAFSDKFPIGDPNTRSTNNSEYWSTPKEFFEELLTYQSALGGNEFSKLHKAKFLIDDNEDSWVSISLDSSLWDRRIDLIFLYAIDYLKYDANKVDLSNNGLGYIRDINNVSGVLLNVMQADDRDVMITSSTNIIKLPIKVKCSMHSSMNSKYQQDQVDHYQSAILDRAPLSTAKDNQFIESYSGDEFARQQIASTYAIDLKGHMTVSPSGIIKL